MTQNTDRKEDSIWIAVWNATRTHVTSYVKDATKVHPQACAYRHFMMGHSTGGLW